MLRAIKRVFSDHRVLRQLNRDMKFEDVKQTFENMRITDKQELIKCKVQYFYALKYLPSAPVLQSQPEIKSPLDSLEQPLIVKFEPKELS